MRRRPDVLTWALGLASLAVVLALAAPAPLALQGRRVLGFLGHGPSAREVALSLDGPEGQAWLRLAARARDAQACVLLADELLGLDASLEPVNELRRAGDGPTPDEREALALYRAAAEEDDVLGAARYGAALVLGIGGPPDAAQGAEWLRVAALRADEVQAFSHGLDRLAGLQPADAEGVPSWRATIDPMTALGDLHALGLGVVKDEAQAIAWYRAALRWEDARRPESERFVDSRSAEWKLAGLLARRPELRQPDDPERLVRLRTLIDDVRRLQGGCGRLERPGAPSRR